jgi:hypothetical protein
MLPYYVAGGRSLKVGIAAIPLDQDDQHACFSAMAKTLKVRFGAIRDGKHAA